jgi:hypothetical protein
VQTDNELQIHQPVKVKIANDLTAKVRDEKPTNHHHTMAQEVFF